MTVQIWVCFLYRARWEMTNFRFIFGKWNNVVPQNLFPSTPLKFSFNQLHVLTIVTLVDLLHVVLKFSFEH